MKIMQCMDYGVYCIFLFLSGTYALFRMSLVSVEVSQTKRKNLNVMPADAVHWAVADDAYPVQVWEIEDIMRTAAAIPPSPYEGFLIKFLDV